MIVAGRVSQKMAPVLRQVYDQMMEPKWVISMGVCACSGGMFNNYAIVQGVDQIVPVDVYAPGCPPGPETLMHAILTLHDQIATGEHLTPRVTGEGAGIVIEQRRRRGSVPVTLGSELTVADDDAARGRGRGRGAPREPRARAAVTALPGHPRRTARSCCSRPREQYLGAADARSTTTGYHMVHRPHRGRLPHPPRPHRPARPASRPSASRSWST